MGTFMDTVHDPEMTSSAPSLNEEFDAGANPPDEQSYEVKNADTGMIGDAMQRFGPTVQRLSQQSNGIS